jgi:DNA-directed RNA polymerase subunit H
MANKSEQLPPRYLPYLIYQQLEKFLTSRGLQLVAGSQYAESKKTASQNTSYLSQEDFTKNIQYYGYVQIEAKDAPTRDRRFRKTVAKSARSKPVRTFILLLDIASVYAKTTTQFAKLLERIPGFTDTKRAFNLDIIVISKDELSVHFEKKIASLVSDGDELSGFIQITPFKYSMFSSNKLEYLLVPTHRIVSKEEEKAILERLMVDKRDLPKIRKGDAIAVWLGAEIGDLIDIDRPSEAAGIEKKYCVVRP